MNRKKSVIIILAILLIALVVFMVNIISKMIIIQDINDKVSKYRNSEHYYEKKVAHFDSGDLIIEHYSKGENAVTFQIHNDKDIHFQQTIVDYYKGEQNNRYVDSKFYGKSALLNINQTSEKIKIRGLDYDNNFWNLVQIAITTPITEVNYNGRKCYFIDSDKFNHPYIDKETGLTLRISQEPLDKINKKLDGVAEFEYKFENFDDSIFTEPDISEYIIEE